MKIIGAEHTSFTVSNLDRSLEFYVDWLGLEVLHIRPEIKNRYFREIVGFPEGVIRGAFLRIPGTDHRLELFEYLEPRGTPADVRTNNPGSAHLAFFVADVRAAYQELTPKGVRVLSHCTLFEAPETWTLPALSHGLLYVQQNEPGRGGTKPRLICYDLRAK